MKTIFTIVISFLLINFASAQQSFRIKGTISDQITGEKIIGVSVKEKGATNGTTTMLKVNSALQLRRQTLP